MNTVENGLINSEAFYNAAAAFYKTTPDQLKAGDPEGFEDFNRKFRIAAFSLEKYTSRVVMPGYIIKSNASKIDDNLAVWLFKTENFYAKDYQMIVESRLVNKWLAGITGLVVLVIAGFLITPRKIKLRKLKKKKKSRS
jgi:hypothetical protein